MCEFKDIIRNVPYFEGYDENSFIGKWYDDGVWDDEEYWKCLIVWEFMNVMKDSQRCSVIFLPRKT